MSYNTATEGPLTDRADVPEGWYVLIDRQYAAESLAVGPYPSKPVAESAFADALLIDYYCQTDCLDAGVYPAADLHPVVELVVIDPNDPHHHGPVR